MNGLSVRTISSLEDLLSIKPQWDALVDSLEEPQIFFTHDWLRIWIESFIPGEKLHIVAVFDGERLAGVLPLYRTVLTTLKVLRRPCLHSISNGNSARSVLIASPAEDERVFRAVFDHLKTEERSFAQISLEHVREDSRFMALLRRELPGTWADMESVYWEDSYELDIEGDFQAYSDGLGKSFRQSMKKRIRQLEKAGAWSLEISDAYDPQVYERFLDLENTGWKREKGDPIKASGVKADFYHEIARTFAPKGQFVMMGLYVGNKPAAMAFSALSPGVIHCFKLAVNYDDPELIKISPGQVLIQEIIRYCFEHHLRHLDFYGPVYPYEAHWTKKAYRTHEILIFKRDDPLMKLRRALKPIIAKLKKRQGA